VFLVRFLARPFGYLAFVVALLALSATARLLGDANELGFFSGRLVRTLWRYPEVTRRGVQMAWLVWALLLAIALSPIDPIASPTTRGLLRGALGGSVRLGQCSM
jgi:hypothetical protein